ncbi:hypothetical protein WJX72_005697 [[Myrmecia] bisecta]|uniref:Uncharacterized protein n=1 Tax=[Myrmecia] bisecta TaxID=41462 RepID=A0AAW1Q1U6_9CHLO
MDPYYDGPMDEEPSPQDITTLVSDQFASLSRLTELTKLELDLSARVHGIEMEWQGPFPEPLCSITRLQTLKVIGTGYARMRGIPTSFSQLAALRDLKLIECGTTHLPTQGLAHLTSLCIKEPDCGFSKNHGTPNDSWQPPTAEPHVDNSRFGCRDVTMLVGN